MSAPATYSAEELAGLLGVSAWSVYSQVREGTLAPELQPIRIGRRMVWPRARVDALLGLAPGATLSGADTGDGFGAA